MLIIMIWIEPYIVDANIIVKLYLQMFGSGI